MHPPDESDGVRVWRVGIMCRAYRVDRDVRQLVAIMRASNDLDTWPGRIVKLMLRRHRHRCENEQRPERRREDGAEA